MGYRVSTVGHIDVHPVLNDDEFEYLTAFGESRRCTRPQGAFWVPSSPFGFEEEVEASTQDINSPPDDQPGLWCPWIPSCRGACLVVREDGTDKKNYGITPWLSYLVKNFLAPGARAQGVKGFEAFTFDHEVSGVIAAHRNDTGELWLVRAQGHRVAEEVLRAGEPYWLDDEIPA